MNISLKFSLLAVASCFNEMQLVVVSTIIHLAQQQRAKEEQAGNQLVITSR